MESKCLSCNEECPQAEMAHNAALGRMYAMNELIPLLKKIDSGELVEVVRCGECDCYTDVKGKNSGTSCGYGRCERLLGMSGVVYADDFCSYGKRRIV